MEFISWEISIITLLPSLFLCGFIYYKDRIEKEPIGLLALLFVIGAALYYPSFMGEKLILGGIDSLFADAISVSATGTVTYSSTTLMLLHKFLCAFIGFALIEVCVKWGILFLCTRNNKHFNYLFDGIVYSVFISLGFATVENLRYAWVNGWDTLVLRSVSSLPCHLIVGIIMGYFYSMWNAYRKAKKLEDECIEKGIITEERIKRHVGNFASSLLVPYAISAVYVFASTIDSRIVNTLFYFVIFSIYGISFITVDRIASKDSASDKFSKRIFFKKHPELDAAVLENMTASAKQEGNEE